MTSLDPKSHLQRQLVLSMRVASDKITELTRQNDAYASIIEALDKRVVELRRKVDSLAWRLTFWPMFALLSAACAYAIHFLTVYA